MITLFENFEEININDDIQIHIDDILNQIEEFMNLPIKNKWIGNDEIKIYIRKSKRYINEKMIDCFDIATIEVEKQGKGLFTKILDQIIQKYPTTNIFIESIMEPRFRGFFKRKGFKYISEMYPENMILLQNN